MSLVVVGSLAYDAVETPHGKIDRMLGGACTYIALSASFFTPVSIVGVVGDDFAAEDVKLLTGKGIDVEGMERVPGKTFFWSGVYSQDMNERTTLQTDLNVFAGFDPKLPASYRGKPYLFLGNIQPGLQKNVRAQMNGVRLVGGDTMNYWINDFRPQLLETIEEWDFLLINDSEARLLSGQSNLKQAAAAIMAMGPKTVIIKRGEYGALLFFKDNHGLTRWFSAPQLWAAAHSRRPQAAPSRRLAQSCRLRARVRQRLAPVLTRLPWAWATTSPVRPRSRAAPLP